MHTLDSHKKITALDKSALLRSIDLLPRQIEQAVSETRTIKLPASYRQIDKVVINGMGGSGLGVHIIQSVYFKKLKRTIGNIHSYDLPGIIDERTLYILSSYSGNTEEPLATLKSAQARGARVCAISSGGQLGGLIKHGQLPGYLFAAGHNPCNQPRMGLGYSIAGLLGLLKQAGVLSVKEAELGSAIRHMKKTAVLFGLKKPFSRNQAKQMAEKLRARIPSIVAAGFLSGNAHTLANQLNENAKTFSAYFIISELNHHLLEGLAFPRSNSKNLFFLFLESALYHPRNQKRFMLTQEILASRKIAYGAYRLSGHTELEQAFEALVFGSYVSFYLAILNNLDPASIPSVDYFKERLKDN